MISNQSSTTLRQYADELRQIAANAKFGWSRRVAEKMADEYESRASAVEGAEIPCETVNCGRA